MVRGLSAHGRVLLDIAVLIAVPTFLAACSGAPATSPGPPATPPGTPPATVSAPPSTPPAVAAATPPLAMAADPRGDVALPDPPAYLDGLAAGIVKDAEAFVFRFTLAEPIPSAPEIPSGWDSLGWSFCLDTDPAAPKGYPFSPKTSAPCEFIILLRSSGGPLQGELIDRRPLQDGNSVVVSPVSLSVDGTVVTASLPGRALGDPASFTWVWATTLLGQLGTNAFMDVDEIPDSSFADPASWPGS